jgi:hypothetical protein
MTMRDSVFTKEGRAALVELTGQLPIQGECWRSTSEGNQFEMPPDYIDIDKNKEMVMLDEPLQKTVVIVELSENGQERIYKRGEITEYINEIVNMLLDPKSAQEGEDFEILGPYKNNFFYWYTDDCSFAATGCEVGEKYQELLDSMKGISIPEAKC